MRKKAIITTVAVLATLLALPIFFQYLDGTSPNAFVQNVTDRLVQIPHIAPIADAVILLWNASVDCVCFPFFRAVELLLFFTKLSEWFILYIIDCFPVMLNSVFVTPTSFLIRMIDHANAYTSKLFFGLVLRENEMETYEIVYGGYHGMNYNQPQCPVNNDRTKGNEQGNVLVVTKKNIISFMFWKCAVIKHQSFLQQCIVFAVQLYQVATAPFNLVFHILKIVASYSYHAVCILFTLLSRALYFLYFILLETSFQQKNLYISNGLVIIAASIFSVVSSFLNIIMFLIGKLEFGLKSLLPGVIQLIATNRFFIFYPMMYTGLILYSIVKLISFIFSVLVRFILLSLQFVLSVIGNVLWLLMSFILLLLVIALLSFVLAVIFVSLIFFAGICEYVIIRFLLKSQPRVLSKLSSAFRLFIWDKKHGRGYVLSVPFKDTCVVCFYDKVLQKTEPCNHRACCYDCIRQIRLNDNRCPLCRSPIY